MSEWNELLRFLRDNPKAEAWVGYDIWDRFQTLGDDLPGEFDGRKVGTKPELGPDKVEAILRVGPVRAPSVFVKGCLADHSAPARCFASREKFHPEYPRRDLWIFTRRSGSRGVYFHGSREEIESPSYELQEMETGTIRGCITNFSVVEIIPEELLAELECWPAAQRQAREILVRHGWEPRNSSWETPGREEIVQGIVEANERMLDTGRPES